jgi:hypothetical protein
MLDLVESIRYPAKIVRVEDGEQGGMFQQVHA